MPDIDPNKLEREIALQLAHGGYATPPGPLKCAEERARALLTVEARLDLLLVKDDEYEPWDGEPEDAPAFLYCISIRRIVPSEGIDGRGRPVGETLASIGMVGVEQQNDPHLRTVFADLAIEVLADEAEEQERVDTFNAAELASRATFAGPAQPDPLRPSPFALRLSPDEATL